MKKRLLIIFFFFSTVILFAKGGKKMENYKTGSANAIFSDYPDPDVIRVDDAYYMVSTTMHFMPGCVILQSYNLIDWEIASYVYDQLDGTPAQRLWDNNGIYGKGMWAASLRYNNGIFYVSFVANDTHQTYLYTSTSIEGPWKKSNIQGFYHDMSILFDEDKVYIVSGNTQIRLVEMESDLSKPKKGGIDKIIIKDETDFILGYEGSHFYKINGKYYVFMIHWPKGKMRTEACFYSDKVDGPYVGGDVLTADYNHWNSGIAQGGIVQTPEGDWYGMLFQDHGALGRIPVLVPVKWQDNFPVFGENGKVPMNLTIKDLKPDYKYEPLYCDGFLAKDGSLKKPWQWNHTPDKRYYSFENDKKGGKLTIKTGKICENVCQAVNTLTQRGYSEHCSASVGVDFSKINEGDFAGLCALEGNYGFIGATKKDGKNLLVMADRREQNGSQSISVASNKNEMYACDIIDSVEINSDCAKLTMECDFSYGKQNVQFFYYDEKSQKNVKLGKTKKVQFTLDHFVGCRFALFIYSTKKEGGSVTFSDFKYIIEE